MKHSLAILLICIFAQNAIAQSKNLDSIERVIINYKNHDTTYINLRLEFTKQKIFLTPNDTTWLTYCLKTLEEAKKINYTKGIALSYERLGVYHYSIATNNLKALSYYQKAINTCKDDKKLAKYTPAFYGNIGNIYYEQQEYKNAIIAYKNLINYPHYQSNCYLNLGNAFTELKQQDSAVVYFNKAITNSLKEGNNMILTLAKSNLSILQARNKEPLKALKNTQESLELLNLHQYEFLRPSIYVNSSSVFLANNDLINAEYYATKALEIESLKNNIYIQKSIWQTLADVYEEKNDFKMALNAYKKMTVYKDSLLNQDKKIEFTKRDLQFENDKNKAIAAAEIERQKLIKNGSIAGGGVLLIITILGLILYKRKRDAVDQKLEAEFNTKVANTELKALRAQMNPHFIFNSLNSINDYISNNDSNAASNYLTKFAKIMRQTLENSTQNEVLLEDDLKLLDIYLQIENMRLENKFTYSIKVSEEIDAENTLVPPLILQPFIENSIWHGLSKKKNDGHIDIIIKKENNMLFCAIEDNGTGRKVEKSLDNTKNKSLGIGITKSRIEIINKKKNTNGSIKMIDKTEGLRVEVTLPLQLVY